MRKVIGIGETILDIIFKNGQPATAVPGGSVFNSMISLGRLQVPNCFISETGTDRVGEILLAFMKENGVDSKSVDLFTSGKSPISIAFLDEENNSDYLFYQQYPEKRLDVIWPRIDENDILLISSYYCVNPELRPRILEFLEYARSRNAIIYYDVNFRKPHKKDALKIMPSIIENFEYADIVRGSIEDFEVIFNMTAPERIYKDKIKFYSPQFICTSGKQGVDLFTPTAAKHYDVPQINTVSTIGAGDSFNAGILFGLLQKNITREELPSLNETQWDDIIRHGIDFASQVCTTYENYIPKDFTRKYSPTLKL